LVREQLGQDPPKRNLFLFASRARSRLKLLLWELWDVSGCGSTMLDRRCVAMPPEELAMPVNGLELAAAQPRKSWLRRAPAA
jgi:hypothetical protein